MSVVLITGCNSGIGKLTALEFARQGASVFASMRDLSNAKSLMHTAEAEDLSIQPVVLDVCDPQSINFAVQTVLQSAGRIDVLVNNAGIALNGVVEDISDEGFQQTMKTNFFGPVSVTRAVLPLMRQQRAGIIVMISSLSAMIGLAGDAAYAASKAALERFSESLSCEVRPFGIQLRVIRPGGFNTPLLAKMLKDDSEEFSEYSALKKHLQADIRNNLGKGDDPELLAKEIVKIVWSDSQKLFLEVGAQARRVVEKIESTNQPKREQLLEDLSGLSWWMDKKIES